MCGSIYFLQSCYYSWTIAQHPLTGTLPYFHRHKLLIHKLQSHFQKPAIKKHGLQKFAA